MATANSKSNSKQKSSGGRKIAPSMISSTSRRATLEVLPEKLPLIPVNQAVIFPGMIVPMVLSQDRHKNMISFLLDHKEKVTDAPLIGVIALKNTIDSQDDKELMKFGVVGNILKKINLPDGSLSILVNCIKRFELKSILQAKPQMIGLVEYLDDVYSKDIETEALARTVVNQFKLISQDNPLITEEMRLAMVNVDGPGRLSDLLASILIRDNETYADFLGQLDVKKRLEKLLNLLKKEIDVHNFQTKIYNEINQNVGKAQRDYFLNEQIKLIQKELGQSVDEKTAATTKFKERVAKLQFSEEAQKRFNDEMEKLDTLAENSPEFGVTYNYLDWMTSLPWGISATENYDLKYAKKILHHDHYGLDDIKERILEFIAVKKLKKNSKGSIICFVGPPGVGKTSLGKSIAQALKRPFFRFSVGGMHDEAEIKGHRRTYVGAMPGKIIQGLKRTGVINPVFMIDEVDKLGNDYRGDPSSALLEVLDPEQNVEFSDHYLDLSFDVGNVLFICTANQTDTIPQPLLDRMEVIQLAGYIQEEKIAIAKKHIIPKQLEKNGLTQKQLSFNSDAIKEIIQGYAREAGVRGLEKWIERISRKHAYNIAMGKSRNRVIKPRDLETLIGPPYFTDSTQPRMRPGMSIGLAWTPLGGEALTIESVGVKSNDMSLKLTGQLGSVMTESANLSWTYVKKALSGNKFAKKYIDENSIHLHVPAGAVPKDGPSAGITLATSLYTLVTNQKIRKGLAMTGELTLTGAVLPVGGIREKIIAAKRNDYKEIILPRSNKRDLKEIPSSIKKGLKFHLVGDMSQVLKIALN